MKRSLYDCFNCYANFAKTVNVKGKRECEGHTSTKIHTSKHIPTQTPGNHLH